MSRGSVDAGTTGLEAFVGLHGRGSQAGGNR